MAISRIGIRQPADAVTGTGPHIFNDETGMHYELCAGDGGRHYVAADHEDVGLVTWYDATLADWDALEVAASESEEDYALACDAQHAANPSRLEGEL